MTREEENKMMIEKTSGTMKGNFNEGILFLVSSISTTLFDISKSLAIIADRLNAQPIEAPVGSVEAVMITDDDGNMKNIPLDRVFIKRKVVDK